ncbi:hypothetical protein QTO34_016260 [Cnephaeus nilssonii]|uniref:Uncharacterized protein n=1 Tax=Cnephaeus nilssonii TaxID=3371016 RepID=A0AA40I5N8_CNENI|nr:hypothetical protein QTO34_016260 [Eptesicus nilssonii]
MLRVRRRPAWDAGPSLPGSGPQLWYRGHPPGMRRPGDSPALTLPHVTCPSHLTEPTPGMELKAPATGSLSSDSAPTATMSTQRLRNEDYADYSSTDVSPDESPSEGLNNFSSSGSYQRFGESSSTT